MSGQNSELKGSLGAMDNKSKRAEFKDKHTVIATKPPPWGEINLNFHLRTMDSQ